MSSSTPGGVTSCVVKVDGIAIPETYQILAIAIEQAVNRVASATLTFLDGSAGDGDFGVSESSSFVPGNTIAIELGYDNRNVAVFTGIVTGQTLRFQSNSGPLLEVKCHDKAIRMAIGRKSAAWTQITDSGAITGLISAAGLGAKVEPTQTILPELVQHYTSDWDFMIARAEVNGLVVAAYGGTVNVIDPAKPGRSVLTAKYGDSTLLSFHAELSSLSQLSQVTAKAWDYQAQEVTSASAQNNVAGPGNLSSKTLAGVVSPPDFTLQTTAAVEKASLSSWAAAQMKKSQLSKITGTVCLQGTSEPFPGCSVTLAGVGNRFAGDHFVSSVRHELRDGNWVTEVAVGLSPEWFVQERPEAAPVAAGQLPGIGGLYNATVLQIDKDPEGEFRVKLNVPMFNDQNGLWARLTNFYSTSGAGAFFLPGAGDEVIVGFLDQDPRFPVILGSVYSQKNRPSHFLAPDRKNSMKGIVSKKLLSVLFDDENAVLTLLTPNKNSLRLDDKNGEIALADQNGNAIVMSSEGIKIHSDKAISIGAAQTVKVEGGTGIKMESAAGDVVTSGLNIRESALVEFRAAGGATASVQGGASLNLKAAMIMIN